MFALFTLLGGFNAIKNESKVRSSHSEISPEIFGLKRNRVQRIQTHWGPKRSVGPDWNAHTDTVNTKHLLDFLFQNLFIFAKKKREKNEANISTSLFQMISCFFVCLLCLFTLK